MSDVLYRFFSPSNELLYIGITMNVPSRFRTHAADKPWWLDVGHVAMEHFPDRVSVEDAERRAIVAERPRYNVVHNARSAPKARRSGVGQTLDRNEQRLRLACSVCQTQFTSSVIGAIHVAYSDMESYDSWRESRRGLSLQDCVMTHDQLMSMPSPAPWRIHCDDCNPHRDQNENEEFCVNCYWIGTDRFSTTREALDWTAHLMEKDWLSLTDWPDLLGRVSGLLA